MTQAQLHAVLDRWSRECRPSAGQHKLNYWQWGDGDPLVIVHGLNDNPRSFAPLMATLSDCFRCIAVALPEHSSLHYYRHEHFTADLIALLDDLKIDSANILGSSFGSTIALRTAIVHPHRIRKAIIQGGFARRPLKMPERFLAHLGRSWPWRMGQLPLRPIIMKTLEAPAFANAPEMLAFLIENSAASSIRAVTHRARILTTLDLRPMLPDFKTPLLMIGGDRDRIVPREYEAEVESLVPQARRIEFANCGHYPQYTHVEPMDRAIREFLG